MSVKVNDQLIPDWAIERQAEALIENLAQSMPGKPREVVQLAALDMAKARLIDQTLMSAESKRRDYKVDPSEVNKGMKQWLRKSQIERHELMSHFGAMILCHLDPRLYVWLDPRLDPRK